MTFQAVFSVPGRRGRARPLRTNPIVGEFSRELAVFREGVLQAGFGEAVGESQLRGFNDLGARQRHDLFQDFLLPD